ncbi:hypothetical protein GQ44DRAFT_601172 [Phaeosphaeriaceae sp. PMI808]|nr:hypothetical protein GQ44DRAFT_601172 [Phaeosphaeriaceae sp. PMI808]
MAQRHICPSMGALRRSIAEDVIALPKSSLRAFSSAARRLDEQPKQPSNQPSSAPVPANPNSNSRRARSATAFKQISSLQIRRIQPGGLARGNFPSGQNPRESASDDSRAVIPETNAGDGRTAKPRFAKFTPRPSASRGTGPLEGQMARTPGTLKIIRNTTVGDIRGPNLGGRAKNRGGPKGSRGPGGREQGPKKRERKDAASSATQSTSVSDIDPSTTLSDGMVHHLLRLQRKEWDRVPYEPKYAHGSFEANKLIHEGREFFKGECPPVKIWGRLEKTIGVVGMFGAEAHLKVRRVPDGDAAPFGKEDLEEIEVTENKEVAKEAVV